MGFIVPASTLIYGSILTAVTLKPLLLRILAMEATATPLPMPDITPPATKINRAIYRVRRRRTKMKMRTPVLIAPSIIESLLSRDGNKDEPAKRGKNIEKFYLFLL